MRKKIICAVALLAMAAVPRTICACSEAGQVSFGSVAPADSVLVAEEQLGDLRLMRLAADTGETMILLLDGAGAPLRLTTESEAPIELSGQQTTEQATTAALAAFPGALILQVESEGELKAVDVATPHLLGTLWTAGGRVYRRDLVGGNFIVNGSLTLDGAFHTAQLLHPEAEFIAMEYDREDDTYEADALVNGVRYELELDARTGRLLEWERD